MKYAPSPLPFTTITGQAAWRSLLGLAAIWLVASCTRLTPPRYNLSSSDPPRLLLQTGERAWIGVRHADLRGVFAMSPAFAADDSFMCVYKDTKSYEFKNATNNDFKDTHIRGCAGYLKTKKKLPRRLLAVIATPDASPAKSGAPATLMTGEPRDGIMCTRRCNRTRRPGQYLKVEIVGAALPLSLPPAAPPPQSATQPAAPAPAPQGEAPTSITGGTP